MAHIIKSELEENLNERLGNFEFIGLWVFYKFSFIILPFKTYLTKCNYTNALCLYNISNKIFYVHLLFSNIVSSDFLTITYF